MKLSGSNFQPWSKFSMDIEGLTVLVGPSNTGKSALFRALQGVLRNEVSEDFVRDGQAEPLEIKLELDGYEIIATRKPSGSTKYKVIPVPYKYQVGKDTDTLYASEEEAQAVADQLPSDIPSSKKEVTVYGKPYSALNGKVPDELEQMNFGVIKVGDTTIDPIFAEQNGSQFLIDPKSWKPSDINAVLGAFSNTEKLDYGKKEANLRITQRKSEASTLAGEVREAEERSAALLKLSDKGTTIAEAVVALESAIRADEALVGQIESTLYHRSKLTPLKQTRDSLTIPDLTETDNLVDITDALSQAADSVSILTFLHKVERAGDGISSLWSDIVTIHKQLRALSGLIELKEQQKETAEEYVSGITSTISESQSSISSTNSLYRSISYLATVLSCKQAIRESRALLTEQESSLELAESELERVRQESAQLVAEQEAKKAALKPGICPRCGKSLEHVCQ